MQLGDLSSAWRIHGGFGHGPYLEDALDQSNLSRLPQQMDSAALEKLRAFRGQCGRSRVVAEVLAIGTSDLCQNQKSYERRF